MFEALIQVLLLSIEKLLGSKLENKHQNSSWKRTSAGLLITLYDKLCILEERAVLLHQELLSISGGNTPYVRTKIEKQLNEVVSAAKDYLGTYELLAHRLEIYAPELCAYMRKHFDEKISMYERLDAFTLSCPTAIRHFGRITNKIRVPQNHPVIPAEYDRKPASFTVAFARLKFMVRRTYRVKRFDLTTSSDLQFILSATEQNITTLQVVKRKLAGFISKSFPLESIF